MARPRFRLLFLYLAALASFAEPVVRRVVFLPEEQPLGENELRERVSVKAGEPLNRLEVRRSIERMFASGRYSDVRVESEPEGDGVTIRFLTEPAWFVGRVTVTGAPEPPGPGQLITATRLSVGQPFYEDQLPLAAENLKRILEIDGLHHAEVEYDRTRDEPTQQAHIDFRVTAGERARFTEPEIRGAAQESVPGIIRSTKWLRFFGLFGWKTVTGQRVNQGLEKIRKYYSDRDLLLNKVDLIDLEYSKESNTVKPVVNVTPGPVVDIQVEGASIRRGKLQNLVPVFQEKTVDRDLLTEGERRITEYLQSQGHFQAKVEFEMREGARGRQTVVYRVDPGPKFKLAEIEISGNRYFDRETLMERMAVTPATRIRYRSGRFSETILRSDVAAVTELYRSNGFRDVHITTEVKTRQEEKDNFLDVVVNIAEGDQWLIESFELAGVDGELAEYLKSLTGSQEGQPFSESTVAVDRDEILGFFYNRGFPQASFDWKAEPGTEASRVALRYEIRLGDPLSVRGVLISGLRASRPKMVDERIRIEAGEPLSQARIVESQRMLHDLGVFARVDTALQNPDGDEKSKYVQFQFEEARRWSASMGIGAEIARIGGGNPNLAAPSGQAGFSPRVSFGLSRLNFLGLGHTISAQTRLSNIQQRTLVSYLVPHFVGEQNLSLSVIGFNDLTRDVNTFTGRRQEVSSQLSQILSRAWTLQGRFAYRRNTVTDLVIDPELVPLYSQPVNVGIVSGTVIRDKRDDPVDSTRGMYHYVDTGLASKKLGGGTSFTRILGRTSNYHKIGREMVFAHSFSIGWQYNLDTVAGAAGVPLPERFYSGGASTHRGFPINQAGPRDTETGFPLGGSALLMNNFELRFPLIGDNLGAVLFHDAGNVYTSFEKISFRARQKDLQDFDYMVHGVGMGFRYRTPIGPIRLDFAYGPNAPRFFGFTGSYDDLINGRGEKVMQRVSRFQFHFSFGQTF